MITETKAMSLLNDCMIVVEGCWLRLKSGISVLNKCNRQLGELLTMLTKICIGGARNRRLHDLNPLPPCEDSIKLAMKMMCGYYESLKWRPPQCVSNRAAVLVLLFAQPFD